MARIASAGFIGRIETTIGPWNGPAGAVAIEVRYIGTVALQVMWRSSMPPSTSASSKENEQPSTKATRSSRQWARMSVGSSISSPSPEHAVARQIGADVEIVGERRQPKIAGRRGRQQRAGLGVELAEPQEIAGEVARQDGEIALHVARREAGGLALEVAAADREPRLAAGLRRRSRSARLTCVASGHGSSLHLSSERAEHRPMRAYAHLITATRRAENRLNTRRQDRVC